MESSPPPPRQELTSETLASATSSGAQISSQNDSHVGSIAERRAAKCGFKAERINTARFRTVSPLTSPPAVVRSPYLTIPPGMSPSALLDSPIMLQNCQPSPTTGSFPFPLLNYESFLRGTVKNDVDKASSSAASFQFNAADQENNAANYQEVGSVERSIDFEFPVGIIKEATTESYPGESSVNMKVLNSMVANANFGDGLRKQMDSVPGENIETHRRLEEEKGTSFSTGSARNSEDGYNWRKYGQKQVKGSEYPRSYYKCTHPNCQVKKKIERSHDGQITEIIYKGTHNHPKPQPNRRAQVGLTSFDEVPEMDDGRETCAKAGSVWKNSQEGSKDIKIGSDRKTDGLERTSSASVLTELSDPLSISQGKPLRTFESAGTPELSSTFVSNDDDDDGATQGSISLEVDADTEESESKRRKLENCLVETNLSSRAVREPRVVVQIESEIDILDDGYRWRKYGQKVVKGNPNPRSYYKCTSAGCSVRKHVERASHNLKYVITTYEGKHNHEVPAAKNSSLSSSGNNLSQANTNTQSPLTLARNTHRIKPETQFQDFATCFETKPVITDDYTRPSFPGNFSNELMRGASSFYPLKYPSYQHAMPYNSMELNRCATHHSGSIASLLPDFQISQSSNLHTSVNPPMAGVDFDYNAKPISHGQPFFSGQQLVFPKQELRDDDHYDAGQATVEHFNGTLSSSVYPSIMGNFPS
ncbi:probable WRKY transcription factor 2 [Mercurialis annua]|uniref:probable WRKY transcription factor 2 n=1 Tax=Mercurialis annua TaxID=3986 RepID=UPI0021601292|nr:probable WRKY transcription factor 2 [Mercurialis annua]